MAKKKIAILSLLRGGIGHYIAQISPYLARDYDLIYISYKFGLPGDEVTLDDLAIKKNITSKPYFVIAYNSYQETNQSLGEVLEILKKEKIDVLNVHIGTIARETSYFLIPLILAAKKIGIKIFYTFHDVESFEEFQAGEEVLKLLYSLADVATIGNEQEKQKLLDKFNFPKNRLAIARHGIYSIFDFKKFDQKSARQHLGIPLNKKVILCFGILRPYKGFDDVILAMPEIIKHHPESFLYISAGTRVFGGPEELQNLIKKTKIQKFSKTNFDFVLSDQIEAIFKASDIVILPYRQVSQSGILNIALYFQKPLIISNLFVEAKKIENNYGLVIAPAKPQEIVRAVTKLVEDQSLCQKFSQNMQIFQQDKTWRETADTYKKMIELDID